MRLVRQVSLFFREGNSDKVYEIDLCTVGNDGYVVNFRYGRRGTPLKEGTKTPAPVPLPQAEALFGDLETQKRAKGYRALAETTGPATAPADVPVTLPEINWYDIPSGPRKAVLRRLQAAAEGKGGSVKTPWKTSRVIWAAGVMKLEEAAPYILSLANKGDAMQRYAAAWALGRCGSEGAAPLLFSCFKSGTPALQRIAAAGLLLVAKGAEREKQLQYHLHSLAEPLQLAVQNGQADVLTGLLQERVLAQVQPHYNSLEDLYLLAQEHAWIRSVLKEILLAVPLRPGYFRHVRHLFKLAEFFDDFETAGLLAHRFEAEPEMFRFFPNPYEDPEEQEVYIASLETYINPRKELAKKSSRLAYSHKTRRYLVKRTLRTLGRYGRYDDLRYVRLATALLLAYDHEKDYAAPYSTSSYVWERGNYRQVETRFPANAHALYLNQLLFGNSPRYKLLPDNRWVTVDPAAPGAASPRASTATASAAGGEQKEGLIQKLLNLFGGKKEAPAPKTIFRPAPEKPVAEKHGDEAPYIELWNRLPQAYVQLLMYGRLDEIHQFAYSRLEKHPEYAQIKKRLDADAIRQLLLSPFDIPAEFGYALAVERYNPEAPDGQLVKAMLYARLEKAQAKGIEWAGNDPVFFLSDTAFVADVLLCPNAGIRAWIDRLLTGRLFEAEAAGAIAVRTLAFILHTQEDSERTNEVIRDAGALLVKHFPEALKVLPLPVVEDLIGSKAAAAQLVGVDLLLLRKGSLDFDTLSNTVFYALLRNAYAPLRSKGMALLDAVSTPGLLKRQELLMECATSAHRDVRSLVRPLLRRTTEADTSFGVHAAEWLLPCLLRKESSEGLHEDVALILREDLVAYIPNINKELALRLLYADFRPTQEFGITILEKYLATGDLSIRQIIALGNHEALSVRQWCWKYFKDNVARIKYEHEEAIRLLDASWDDTRAFAKEFFRTRFEENDWTPEVLVGLADSVRPDIEAFGRELITRFFRDEQGGEYLVKLSQHPSEKMQLFATNYLERFATGDLEKLRSLEFYFRSVLTRVNKARVAKNRIFRFLAQEGKRSEEAAQFVAGLVSQLSATVSVEDKARCIQVLHGLQTLYEVQTPMIRKPIEERI